MFGTAGAQTDKLYDECGNAYTPKFKAVSASSAGNNTLVAAVTGKKIRVLAGLLYAAGTVTATIQTAAGGTALTGAFPLLAQVGFQVPYCPLGNFETVAGELLNLNLGGAVAVTGWLVYIEV